jgi:prepilin-type N-terminal cleavage/methylation domain-containing protein
MTRRESGFSLVELMVTLVILAMVVAALMVVMIGSQRSKASTESLVEAQQSARVAAEIISEDIRSAGYGVDKDAVPPQPAFAYVDSTELILYGNLQPMVYRSSASPSPTNPPLAPAPQGSPKPPKVAGSVYPAGYALPTSKWRGGAEMIRYTLDVNNDGVVDGSDQSAALASDAARSANPNDFMLARVVYGDSSGSTPTAGNNGGTMEKVGLVRGPGTGVPPLFTVYLGSNPTPWDWASGPVPADRLDEISRVLVSVTTEARRPDRAGNYARATVTTEVNSLRNVPEAGNTTYAVDGYVFVDLNLNQTKEVGEPGIPHAVMRLGTAGVAETNAQGYYILSAAPAQYTLRQEVPEGYGAFAPDTFVVNFLLSQSNVTHSFADTARHGGWIVTTCWQDTDGDDVRDVGEPLEARVPVTVNGDTRDTDGSGQTAHFVSPGTWTVSATAPDSMYVTTTNPLTVTVVDGDTTAAEFGLVTGGTGTVTGKVWKDLDRDGVVDAGEPGIPGVWVAITKNATTEVLGFATTDASGDYSVEVPSNDPDHVTPYELTYQVPNGYYPIGSTVVQPIWLDPSEVIAGMNFAVQSFNLITLTADRVLSLGAAELREKDWTGNDNAYATNGHKDVDLILGSEYVSNPNISVWFNRWDTFPYFSGGPTYSRNAQASALSLAAGCLDAGTEPLRPDVVTGLVTYASGNIAVWLTQNTSGNFGYLPTNPTYYKTQDNGDVNAVLLNLCDANATLDLIVGTKSYANTGTLEIWLNNGSGVLTRDEIYPTGGGVPAGGLGEIRAMALGNFDADSDSDLVVVTKTSDLYGKLHVFEKIGTGAGNRFQLRLTGDLSGEGNAVAVLDVDGDGRRDFVIGTKTNSNSGKLEYWRNGGSFGFTRAREVNAPGIVLSLAAADYGGLGRADLAVGFRDSDVSYSGGVRIYSTDSGTLANSGVDPAAGTASYMTPAATTNDFNYGANPLGPSPQLPDIAVAQKPTATTGQVIVFIR